MTFDSCGNQPAALTDDQLRQLTEKRAPFLQQLSEGVIIADADGRLVFVNEAAERLHDRDSLVDGAPGPTRTDTP